MVHQHKCGRRCYYTNDRILQKTKPTAKQDNILKNVRNITILQLYNEINIVFSVEKCTETSDRS